MRPSTLCAIPFCALALLGVTDPVSAQDRPTPRRSPGRLTCNVTENGRPASATLVVRDGDRTVAQGTCDRPLQVPAGSYSAVVTLDGALDRAEHEEAVEIRSGQTATVRATFRTGRLEVQLTAGGRRAAGMATIFRNGQRVGTLASGVEGNLSAGTYRVVVRYRTEERTFDAIAIPAGEKRNVEVTF